jgi:hypothetical protein
VDEVEVSGKPIAHARRGQAGIILPPNVKALNEYVAHADETARFRQQSEFLRTDERGAPIRLGDTEAEEAAAQRYVKAQLENVLALTTRRDGLTMNPRLTGDLLHGRIPSAADLRDYGGIDELPKHVIQAQFLPAAPKTKAGKVAQGVGWYTKILAGAYDFMVTRPMQIRAAPHRGVRLDR